MSKRGRHQLASVRRFDDACSALASGLRERFPELEAAIANRIHAIADPRGSPVGPDRSPAQARDRPTVHLPRPEGELPDGELPDGALLHRRKARFEDDTPLSPRPRPALHPEGLGDGIEQLDGAVWERALGLEPEPLHLDAG